MEAVKKDTKQKTLTITLGNYWNKFIDTKLQEGRFVTASEIIRESLRSLEEKDSKENKLFALRAALEEGENSGYAPFNPEETLKKAKKEAGLDV